MLLRPVEGKRRTKIISSFKGIRKCRYFGINNSVSEFQTAFPKGFRPESKKVWITFDGKTHMPSYMDDVYIMDGKIFLNELFDGIKLLQDKEKNKTEVESFIERSQLILEFFGIQYSFESLGKLTIEKRKIESPTEIEELPTQFIFNCMGVFSKKIFKDDNLYGVKGSMIYYKNVNNVKDVYQVTIGPKKELLMMPYFDVVAIGVTKSRNPIDIVEDREIMKKLSVNIKKFFSQKL